MTKKPFNAAAYKFDYNAEVAAFYKDWPARRQDIFFIEIRGKKDFLHRGREPDEDEIASILGKNGSLYSKIETTKKDGVGGSARFEEEGYDCIFLRLPTNATRLNFLGYGQAAATSDVFTFDHEIGHAICEGGREKPNLKECVAEAYAVIRHFQRFKKDAAVSLSMISHVRAAEMAFSGISDHFTGPVIEKIITDSATIDFASWSPQKTAEMAHKYATNYAMEPLLLADVAKKLSNCQCDFFSLIQGKFDGLYILGNYLLSAPPQEEFKWGAAAVCAVLDGELAFDGKRIDPPTGKKWTQLRKALDARLTGKDIPQQKSVNVGGIQLVIPT